MSSWTTPLTHYKSWSGLNKQLIDCLCDPLKDRVSYFLTRYHDVHNSYGRAAILLDKKELVCFSWTKMQEQEYEVFKIHSGTYIKSGKRISYDEIRDRIRSRWDENCTYHEKDFLCAATGFLQLNIADALKSGDLIIRIFAVMDKRVGKRTLQAIKCDGEYRSLPEWVKQFYELRFKISGI